MKVDLNRRRPLLYHVVYTDGDEEDYEDAELQCALDRNEALKSGAKLVAQDTEDKGM